MSLKKSSFLSVWATNRGRLGYFREVGACINRAVFASEHSRKALTAFPD